MSRKLCICLKNAKYFVKKAKKGVSLATNHVKGVKMYFVRSFIVLTAWDKFYTLFI